MPKRSFGFFRRKQGRCSNVGALYIFGLSELTVPVTPSAPYRKERVSTTKQAEQTLTVNFRHIYSAKFLLTSTLTATSDSKLMI